MKQRVFTARPLGTGKLKVIKIEKVDGELKEVDASFDLVMDFNAFNLAREKTNRDFAAPESWQNLPYCDLVTLCWCSLQRFHSEVTIEELGTMLGPSQSYELWMLMMELCFPGAEERIAEAAKKLEQEAASGEPQGEARPAAEIATPSTSSQ